MISTGSLSKISKLKDPSKRFSRIYPNDFWFRSVFRAIGFRLSVCEHFKFIPAELSSYPSTSYRIFATPKFFVLLAEATGDWSTAYRFWSNFSSFSLFLSLFVCFSYLAGFPLPRTGRCNYSMPLMASDATVTHDCLLTWFIVRPAPFKTNFKP